MQFLQDKDFWNFVEHGTDTFRIFISKGALVERMGDGSIISYFLESDLETALRCLDKWTRRIHWTPQWVLARQRIKQPKHWKAPFFVQGKGFSPIQIVHENGLKYEIIFSTGHSGLFCDQRSNRLHLMQLKPKNLLNCFAYTCAFSVAAASTGSQTVNIDLAKRPLTRGRRNFNLNNIALNGRHRFLVEDVFSMLPKFARRGEKFHCIILDPPTFSQSKRNSYFQVQHDFASLLKISLACVASKGHVLLSTNCVSMRVSVLHTIAVQVTGSLSLPVRFFTPKIQRDALGGPMPRTIWMELLK